MHGQAERIRVLQVLRPFADGGNPYGDLLVSSIPTDEVDVRYFSWPRAVFGGYDILHVHWPEQLVRGHGVKGVVKRVLALALLFRASVGRIAVVRTVHNVRPHEPGTRFEAWFLGALDRYTSHWIVMNSATPVSDPARTTMIPHGHYRNWYPEPSSHPIAGRITVFGLIREYKQIDRFVEVFADTEDSTLSLMVAGKPATASIQSAVETAAADDPRICLRFAFLADDDLSEVIAQSEMVAIPYREVHNSGVALLALSLNRPVIMPSGKAVQELADEFGPEWVVTYDTPLTSAKLARSFETIRSFHRPESLDMSSRNWDLLGSRLASVYRDIAQGV